MNGLLRAISASVFLVVTASAALADGMPAAHRGSMRDPELVAPCCEANWSGLYIAGSVGYTSTSSDVFHQVIDIGINSIQQDDISSNGATGTIAVGYDRMFDGFVLGAFADYTGGDLDGSGTLTAPGFIDPYDLTYEDTWAVGVRFGVSRSCCTLWYVTVGYTQADLDFDDTFSEKLSGYFVGGGVEQIIRDGWSLKLEYRYANLGDENIFSGGDCLGCSQVIDLDPEIHSVRLGVSYKFGFHDREVVPLK